VLPLLQLYRPSAPIASPIFPSHDFINDTMSSIGGYWQINGGA
jgi:hypothetical protein